MKQFLIVACLLFSLAISAQDKPPLVTDRPDQTESAVTVPLRSLQVETGFLLEQSTSGSVLHKSFAYNTTLLRYGILNQLELRLGFEYLGDKNGYSTSGFGPLYTGFKIKITEEEGWKPGMAFLTGLSFPFTAGEYYKPEYTAADMRLAFAHTLTETFSLSYNLGAEWNGESAIPGYFYSVAAGIGITKSVGMFVESYGLIPETGQPEHLLDAGFTLLLLANLQLDISGGIGLNEQAADHFISFGVSYRLPE